jgi:uncharacterized protein
MEIQSDQALELRPPRNRVSRKAIRYWAVRASVAWLAIAGVQVVWLLGAGHRSTHVVLLCVTAVLAAAHVAVMPTWRYRVHRWEAAPSAVYTQSGWFDQERRIAPVSRIQTVDTERGPFAQLFGLANVTVTTASAAGPLTIEGLDQDVAERLAEDLTAVAAAAGDDAT